MSTETTRVERAELRRDVARPVRVGADDFVVWCSPDGGVRSAPRRCPHLDADLAGAPVIEGVLVCPSHGWSLDGTGAAFKRNERGRIDPKGAVAALTARDDGDGIEFSRA